MLRVYQNIVYPATRSTWYFPAVSGREDGRLRSDTRRPRHTRSLHVHSTTGGVDNFVKELGT